MTLPEPYRSRIRHAAARTVTLSLLALACAAAAQACPEREIELEQPDVGVVRAESLEYEDDTALLERACLELDGLILDAGTARASENGLQATGIHISGSGLSGTAARLATRGPLIDLFDLRLDVRLPTTQLPGAPLPAGQYQLRADRAEVQRSGDLRFGDATLQRAGTGETYRVVNARLQGQHLTAGRVELGRLEAQTVDARPRSLRTGPALVGLCRDPRGRELALEAGAIRADAAGATLTDPRLRVFGLGFPLANPLVLPIRARGDTLADTTTSLLNDAELLRERFGRFNPQLVTGSGRFGVRNLPLFDENGSRLNLAWHPSYLELGLLTQVGGADVAFGVFQDPSSDVVDDPMPVFSVTRTPTVGEQAVFALRGSDELSESRLGYAWGAGLGSGANWNASGRLVVDGGIGYQAGVADAFARARGEAFAAWREGPVSVGGAGALDVITSTGGNQVAAELLGNVSWAAGPVAATAAHQFRRVSGTTALPALRAMNASVSSFGVTYSPDLDLGPVTVERFGYAYGYDWLARSPTTNAVTATLGVPVGSADVTPTVSYDLVSRRLGVSSDVALYSDCFTYGAVIDAYTGPQGSGIGARLKFNLR